MAFIPKSIPNGAAKFTCDKNFHGFYGSKLPNRSQGGVMYIIPFRHALLLGSRSGNSSRSNLLVQCGLQQCSQVDLDGLGFVFGGFVQRQLQLLIGILDGVVQGLHDKAALLGGGIERRLGLGVCRTGLRHLGHVVENFACHSDVSSVVVDGTVSVKPDCITDLEGRSRGFDSPSLKRIRMILDSLFDVMPVCIARM